MMKAEKLTPWAKGAPPCVGWWNASVARDPECRRWWDGCYWSEPVFVGESKARARRAKAIPTSLYHIIEWRGLVTPRGKA